MGNRINLDPISRIEGHLAIHLDIEQGMVSQAACKGEMFRGFEVILKGRDPLDAQQITQRICGVCPASHGIASILAQDQAYGITPPDNGRLIRNIILGANFLQSHLTHFYQLSAMDFVDITAITGYTGNDSTMLHMKQWVASELKSKKIFPATPFLPRYQGKYLKRLSVVQHYLSAYEMRQIAHQCGAELGGKLPHVPAFVPGGVTEKITSVKLSSCVSRFKKLQQFIEQAFVEDLMAVARHFSEYWHMGSGPGNYLCYGVFQESNDVKHTLFPSGVILDGTYRDFSPDLINEDVTHAFYTSDSGGRPMQSQTLPEPGKKNAYTWIKAPRYDGHVMEVGPLARILVSYQNNCNPKINRIMDQMMDKLKLNLSHFDSVLGRHAARLIECKVLVERCLEWMNMLDPSKPVFTTFETPDTCSGTGFTEAPRGALAHYLSIKNKRIDVYQCVVPTTWNCSPRDAKGKPGALELALKGTKIKDKANPLEATRIIRSFDPCLACAVH